MSAKHTPGSFWVEVPPGRARYAIIDTEDGSFVVCMTPLGLRMAGEASALRHETGCTPFQLAEQRDDLLAALKKAVADYGRDGGPWNVPNEPGAWLSMARSAIADAEGGAP